MRLLTILMMSVLVGLGGLQAANSPQAEGAATVVKNDKKSKRIANLTQKIEKKLAKKARRGGDTTLPAVIIILLIVLLLLLLGYGIVTLLILALVLFLLYYFLSEMGAF